MECTPPFIVNARELRAAPRDYEVSVEPSDLNLHEEEFRFVGTITGNLSWKYLDDRFLCHGRLKGRYEADCVRCLRAIDGEVDADIRIVFSDEPADENAALDFNDEDDEGIVHFRGDRIDAREEIRAELLVLTPMLPWCSEDCKGLCAQCGADLNEGPCNCEPFDDSDFQKAKENTDWKKQIDGLRDIL